MPIEKIPSPCRKIYDNYKKCLKNPKLPPEIGSPHLLCALSGPCTLKRNNCSFQSAILTICLRRVKFGGFV